MSFFRRAGASIARIFQSSADPAAETDKVLLYGKDAAGVSQLFARSDDGTVHQITPASGGGGGVSQSLIFKPGSADVGPVVFNTWAGLYAKLAALRLQANGGGSYTIQCDDSLAVVTIPAGAYDMTNVTLAGISTGKTLVTLANGVVFTALRKFRNVIVTVAVGGTSPISFVGGTPIVQLSRSILQGGGVGTPPVLTLSGAVANANIYLDDESYLTTLGQPAVDVQDTSTVVIIVGVASQVAGGSVACAVGGQVDARLDTASSEWTTGAAILGTFNLQNFTYDRNLPTQVWTDADSPFSANDGELVRIDGSGAGAIVADLPSVYSGNSGKTIIFKEVSGSVVGGITLTPNGADTIDGAASLVLPAVGYQSLTIISDGISNWSTVSVAPPSAGASPSGVFVWEVGVAWATIYAQMLAAAGPKICLVEGDSAGGGRNIPAGLYDLNDVYFWGMDGTHDGQGAANTVSCTRINLADGVTLAPVFLEGFNHYMLRSKDIAWWFTAPRTIPLYTIAGFNQGMFYLDGGEFRTTGRIASGRTVAVLRNGAAIRNTGGLAPLFVTTSGTTLTLNSSAALSGAITQDDTGAWNVDIFADSSCFYDAVTVGAPGTLTVTLRNRAVNAAGALYRLSIDGLGNVIATPG